MGFVASTFVAFRPCLPPCPPISNSADQVREKICTGPVRSGPIVLK